MNLRKTLKKMLIESAVRLVRRPKLTRGQLLRLDPKTVLIVRQHNQMGDMVCATPALRAIRRAFPRAKLALVCAPLNWDVVRHNPDLDRVLVFDKKSWVTPHRLLRFGRQLRAMRPDLAFVLNSVSFSVTSAMMALCSGAEVIVGGDSRPFGYDISRFAYSLEMPSRPELDRHAVEHSLEPLRAVGIDTDDLSTVAAIHPDEETAAFTLTRQGGLSERFWLMHPGAGKRENLWPVERFAEIAIRAAVAARVAILQGPADGPVIAAFNRCVRQSANAEVSNRLVVLPVQPVGVCAALMVRADRFLCNDTGLMHVAGAVGVPTVALFGPTDPSLWKPLAACVQAVRAEGGDLGRLPTETVWRALSRLEGRQTVIS